MKLPPIDPTLAAKPLVSVQEVTRPDVQADIDALRQAQDASGDPSATFTQAIRKAIGEVNNLSTQADKLAVNLASGDVEDVHKAMIAMQKAKLALEFTIQVRNKVIEAYQEIMRMQV